MQGLMRDTFEPDALSSLPIFPLPNCVLLPGGLLPRCPCTCSSRGIASSHAIVWRAIT
jgi:hypothetical protein